jgi:mannosyltransferase
MARDRPEPGRAPDAVSIAAHSQAIVSGSRGRRFSLALGALLVLAAALRFPTLGQQSYWEDEILTVGVVKGSLHHALATIPKTEQNPPLYYMGAWLWSKLFGTGEVALRSLSAVFGTATVPVAFAAGRQVAGGRVGVIAAALIAVNPLLVWYSQEARAYALVVFLGGVSFLLFTRALAASSTKVLAAWAFVSSLAIATHYFAAFLVAAEAIYLIFRARQERVIEAAPAAADRVGKRSAPGGARPLLAAVGTIAATCIALAPLAIHQLPGAGGIGIRPLSARLGRLPQLIIGLNASTLQVVLGPAITVVLVCSLWLLLRRGGVAARRRIRAAAVVGVATIAAPVVLALIGLDFLNTRNVLPALFPCALVIAVGLAFLRSGLPAMVLCALFVALTINVDLNPALQRTNFRGAAKALGPVAGNRAVGVLLAGNAEALEYYLPRTRIMPSRAVRIGEIDLLGLSSHIGSNRGVIPPPTGIAFPGFFETGRDMRKTFSLIRFRSLRPREITPAFIAAAVSRGPQPDTLVQLAPRP